MSIHVVSVCSVILLVPTLAWAQQTLEADLIRVTDSAAIESTPSLGRDDFSDLVVYSSRPNNGGDADIQYSRILNGLPTAPITLPGLSFSGGASDDVLNDIDGSRVVFTAYSDGLAGSIVTYDLADGRLTVLASAPQLFEARVYGDYVIWNEGDGSIGRVQLQNLQTGVTQTLAESPLVVSVDIDRRFAVYSIQVAGGFTANFAYELATGTTIPLPQEAESSSLVPRTSGDWVAWQITALFDNPRIVALNLETNAFVDVTDGSASAFRPTLDGDLIAYETDAYGQGVDVALYRISTGETFPVTVLPGDQFLTDVFGPRVAYVDNAQGQNDVFYAELSFVDPLPPFACPSDDAEAVCDLGCGDLVLTAKKTYGPSTWFDGEACLCEPSTFVLPEELTVTAGNAGNHWTDVIFEEGGEEVLCRYRGGADQAHPSSPNQIRKGLVYVFDFCTDGRSSGDRFTTQYVRVYLANGDSYLENTEVEASFAQPGCEESAALQTRPATAVAAVQKQNETGGCTAAMPSSVVALVGLLGLARRRRRRH